MQSNETTESSSTEVHCYCQQPYEEGEDMICCDKCDVWYHFPCVGLTSERALNLTEDEYTCPSCKSGGQFQPPSKPIKPSIPSNAAESSPINPDPSALSDPCENTDQTFVDSTDKYPSITDDSVPQSSNNDGDGNAQCCADDSQSGALPDQVSEECTGQSSSRITDDNNDDDVSMTPSTITAKLRSTRISEVAKSMNDDNTFEDHHTLEEDVSMTDESKSDAQGRTESEEKRSESAIEIDPSDPHQLYETMQDEWREMVEKKAESIGLKSMDDDRPFQVLVTNHIQRLDNLEEIEEYMRRCQQEIQLYEDALIPIEDSDDNDHNDDDDKGHDKDEPDSAKHPSSTEVRSIEDSKDEPPISVVLKDKPEASSLLSSVVVSPGRGGSVESVGHLSSEERRSKYGWSCPTMSVPIRGDVRSFDFAGLAEAQKRLSGGKLFDAIMMDPPWQLATANPTRGVAIGYDQLADSLIAELPIPRLQLEGGLLLIWVINAKYRLALELFKQWGYRLISDIAWVKQTVNRRIARGHGFYLQHAKETCLIGVKCGESGDSGGCFTKDTVRKVKEYTSKLNQGVCADVIFSERRGQSQKPTEIYEYVETLVPDGYYLEIFGRRNNLRDFWVTIGNEL